MNRLTRTHLAEARGAVATYGENAMHRDAGEGVTSPDITNELHMHLGVWHKMAHVRLVVSMPLCLLFSVAPNRAPKNGSLDLTTPRFSSDLRLEETTSLPAPGPRLEQGSQGSQDLMFLVMIFFFWIAPLLAKMGFVALLLRLVASQVAETRLTKREEPSGGQFLYCIKMLQT